jgi:nickel-dependent lactate racemase
VRFIRDYAQVALPRRFHTVVTSAAGYPLDKTYYQTVKGMVSPLDILAPGGNLIIASECSEGIGSPEYREAQRRLLARGVDGFFADISRKSHADIDEWQTQMQLKPMRRGSVHLYTTGCRRGSELTGVNLVDSVSAAVLRSTQETRALDVAVIPEGPYVVPVFRPAA